MQRIPPKAPTNLSAAAGDSQVELTWENPGDGTIAKYQVSQDGGSWTDIPSSNATTTAHTVTSLINGNAYEFRIRAVNSVGLGEASASVSGSPAASTEDTAYLTHNGTSYTIKGPTQVRWGETAAYIHEGGTPQPRLAFQMAGGKKLGEKGKEAQCADCLLFVSEESGSGHAATFEQSDAKDWGGFRYTVMADSDEMLQATAPWASASDIGSTFDVGFGQESTWAWRATTTEDPTHFTVTILGSPPEMPAGFSAVPGEEEVTLAWDDPGNKSITGYQYRQSEDGGLTWSPGWEDIFGSGPNTIIHTVGGLANGVEYTFAIRAVNTVGSGAPSVDAHATPGVPDAPGNLTTWPDHNRVVLTWETPEDNGAAIANYQYRQSDNSGDTWGPDWGDVPGSSATTTVYSVEGLTNAVVFTFQLRAVNAHGNGATAQATSTPATIPPQRPTGLAATAGDGQATLRWDDPRDPTIIKYDYTSQGASTADIPRSGYGQANHTSYTVTGLTNGVEHTFSIIPYNHSGNGIGSQAVMVTPIAPTPPTPPAPPEDPPDPPEPPSQAEGIKETYQENPQQAVREFQEVVNRSPEEGAEVLVEIGQENPEIAGDLLTGIGEEGGGGEVLGSMSEDDPETTGRVIVSAALKGPMAPIICAGAQENPGGVGQALNHGAREDVATINQTLGPAQNDRQCVNTLGGEIPVQTWIPETPPQEGGDPSGEGEWQDIGSPFPVDNILGRFRSAIAGAKTVINNLTSRPTHAEPLPQGRIPYGYVDIERQNFTNDDLVAAHVSLAVERSWLDSNQVHQWSMSFSRYDQATTTWVPTQSKRVREDEERVYYSVTVPGFSLWALHGSTEAPQVEFLENDLSIAPPTIEAGGEATVSFNVTNTTGQASAYIANLWLNQQISHSLEVPVGAGQTQAISLPLVIAVPGTYEVRVGRQIAAEPLEVVAASPAPTPVPARPTPVPPAPPLTPLPPPAVLPTPAPVTAPPAVAATLMPVAPTLAPSAAEPLPAAPVPAPEVTTPPPTPEPALAGVSVLPVIGEIGLSNPSPAAGEELVITVPISHLGATSQDFPLEVLVGGQVVHQEVVTALPGETVRVEVIVAAPESPADITVRVDDQARVTPVAPIAAGGIGLGMWLLIGIVAVVAILVIAVGAFYLRRRRAAA